MKKNEAPLLAPAAGFLLGVVLASSSPAVSAPVTGLAALVAGLGLALGRPAGVFVAAAACGLLWADARWLGPGRGLDTVELNRPVEIVGRVTSHPMPVDEGTRLRVRSSHLVQSRGLDRRVVPVAVDVWVQAPSSAAVPILGTTVRLRGLLKRSAPYRNGNLARPGPWRLRLKSAAFLRVEAPPPAWQRAAGWLRQRADAALASPSPSPGLALARALLLGDRTTLPLSWQQALRRGGLAHLLAVSGLHVGLVAFLAVLLASPCPRWARLLAAAVAILLYLALLGPRPAALRAALMGCLGLAALAGERPPQALNAIAGAALLLLVADPSLVADLGFQLSFAATCGIVVLARPCAERWTALPGPLRQPLAVTFAAQVSTWPLLVPLTGTVHPLAPLLNLVALPWLAVFLAASLGVLAAAVLDAALAARLTPLLDLLAWPVERLAGQAPSRWEAVLVDAGALCALAAAVLLVTLACRPRHAPGLALVALLLSLRGAPAPVAAPVELVLLDVGQGDAILLRDGDRALLVDGGGWRQGDLGGRVLLPALAASGVRRLDAVAVTHGDQDHCGGLADLLRYLPVGELWTPPELGGECGARILAAPGPRHRPLRRGDRLRLGRWQLDVLSPEPGDAGAGNDLSLVLLASVFGRRALLTGDVEAAGERLLVRRERDALRADVLRSDVLKVAHHGSRTSTSAAWLRAVEPRLALISAGADNTYGHPAPAVLERLHERGVLVLRTDLAGRIVLRFHDDGRILIDQPLVGG